VAPETEQRNEWSQSGRTSWELGENRVRAGSGSVGAPVPRSSRAERYAAGKALREVCPREAQGCGRPRPAGGTRSTWSWRRRRGVPARTAPLRHGRMVRSAFTFYRGAALTMAADLASTLHRGPCPVPAATPTCATSAALPTPERKIISASTTSTRRCRHRWSGHQAPRRELRRGLQGQRARRHRRQGRGPWPAPAATGSRWPSSAR